jgi:transposase-like protein
MDKRSWRLCRSSNVAKEKTMNTTQSNNWLYWLGAGGLAYLVYRKLTQKPAWEMNARRSQDEDVEIPRSISPRLRPLYKKVLRLYEKGESPKNIAKKTGAHVGTVKKWLKESGVSESFLAGKTGPPRDDRLYEEALLQYVPGEPVPPLAEALGVSVSTVIRWMKEAGIYVPAPKSAGAPSRDESLYQEALRQYVPGEPVGPLAKSLGVSINTVIRWMKDADVYVPAPRGRKPPGRDKYLYQHLYEKALKLYIPGEPVSSLARELGVSRQTIVNWMKEAGVYVPVLRSRKTGRSPRMEHLFREALRQYVPGEPIPPLARELGVSDFALVSWLKEAGVYEPAPAGYSRDEQLYQDVLRRYIPGDPVPPLAKEFGVSVSTIIRWMKEAGVYVPARKGRKS